MSFKGKLDLSLAFFVPSLLKAGFIASPIASHNSSAILNRVALF